MDIRNLNIALFLQTEIITYVTSVLCVLHGMDILGFRSQFNITLYLVSSSEFSATLIR
jgi:hypothetical protein